MRDEYDDAQSCAKILVQWLVKTTNASTWSESVLDQQESCFTAIILQFLVNKEAQRDE